MDHPGPSSQSTVHLKHQGHGSSNGARFAVTSMANPAPRGVLQTLLTDSSVTKKRRRRAEQPVIVKGLHHGNACLMASVVGGWRDQRQCVVEVNQIKLAAGNERTYLTVGVP